ncbi:membrane-associated PAP2 superfamily phosphatase [Thioclava sp. ES.031]|uniref:phosphatase PAP2 family protein n=1 Tax=Thioclava sp. ES.031 TaxID=1798203 RepID=UPI000C004E98|nr:phosphatase PAP2 family protein [Thioclava sp. ES.031]PFG64867.1 membrane-associated PAP2 superfamily phosphatase [Thioclava sp. ES.031]
MSVPKIDMIFAGRLLLAAWIGGFLLFRFVPELDLGVAGLFYRAGEGFSVITNPLWEWLRQRIWDVSIVLFLVSLVAWPWAGLRHRTVLRLPARIWAFICLLYLLGPIVVVNGVLKANSGRARPADVDLFGGAHHFSLAGTFTDQCSRNCSFVSGEVAAAVALGLLIWLGAELSRLRLPRWGLRYLRAIGVFVAVFIILQRVGTGRHFLSDAYFAGLVSLSVAWLLWGILFAGWGAQLLARTRRES